MVRPAESRSCSRRRCSATAAYSGDSRRSLRIVRMISCINRCLYQRAAPGQRGSRDARDTPCGGASVQRRGVRPGSAGGRRRLDLARRSSCRRISTSPPARRITAHRTRLPGRTGPDPQAVHLRRGPLGRRRLPVADAGRGRGLLHRAVAERHPRALRHGPQIKYFETACITDNAIEAILLPDPTRQQGPRRCPHSAGSRSQDQDEKGSVSQQLVQDAGG